MNSKPTRRNFFGHAGAALTVPLATTTVFAADGPDAELAARLAALEDADAIRALQQRYVRLVNGGAHGDAAALFVDAARAVVDVSVRHVTPTGDAGDTITFGADGTATASLHCAVKTATPIEGDGTLVEMARLQGDGILQGTELRVLESTFVKRADGWKIDRLAYRSA